jgi:hypothetical protein
VRMFLLISGLVLLGLASGCTPSSQQVKSSKNGESITIDNGILSVCYDLKKGTFCVRRGEELFITGGRFPEAGPAYAAKLELRETRDTLGPGKAIQVKFPSGHMYRLGLYKDLPFVSVNLQIQNRADGRVVVDKIVPVNVALDLGKAAKDLRVLGCDGLTSGEEDRASYTFLAVADPSSRAGVVAGWITQERASGIVLSRAEQSCVRIEGRSEYGKLLIQPGRTAKGETFAIGYFDDALVGLEDYAAAIAKAYRIALPKVPCGYCSWYSEPYGHASDEQHMAELAEFCRRNLRQFGLEALQIDDRWQAGPERKGPRADYSTHHPDGPYPSGMKPIADKIKTAGLMPGIWFLPFGSDPRLKLLEGHQDWFARRSNGELFEVKWAGTCLDITHPDVQRYVRNIVSRITREWGYKYTKIDGLYTGMAVDSTYPEPDYRTDDNFGDAGYYNPTKTNVEAFRDGLKLVREAAGHDVFILGCTIAQNMRTMGASFGLVDAMRIGRDTAGQWKKIRSGAQMGTRLYFLHNRVWYNDPDCLLLREPMTLEQARAWGSWIAVTGQLNMVSEWLPGLPRDKLEVVKRSMPNHGLCARPLDLFENALPHVWHLTAGTSEQRKDILGLFNWDEEQCDLLHIELGKLKLPNGGEGDYIGFDYWENKFIWPFSGVLKAELQPSSCRVIAVRPLLERPQLVSTSRHITQGVVDVIKQEWDSRTKVLSGKSKVVGADPYELRIFVPTGGFWQVTSADVSNVDRKTGVAVQIKQTGPEIRIRIDSPENREVTWKVAFKDRQ